MLPTSDPSVRQPHQPHHSNPQRVARLIHHMKQCSWSMILRCNRKGVNKYRPQADHAHLPTRPCKRTLRRLPAETIFKVRGCARLSSKLLARRSAVSSEQHAAPFPDAAKVLTKPVSRCSQYHHAGKAHRIVLEVDIKDALLLAQEGAHRQQELGDVVRQPVGMTQECSETSESTGCVNSERSRDHDLLLAKKCTQAIHGSNK